MKKKYIFWHCKWLVHFIKLLYLYRFNIIVFINCFYCRQSSHVVQWGAVYNVEPRVNIWTLLKVFQDQGCRWLCRWLNNLFHRFSCFILLTHWSKRLVVYFNILNRLKLYSEIKMLFYPCQIRVDTHMSMCIYI